MPRLRARIAECDVTPPTSVTKPPRITSYNVCYTKLLRLDEPTAGLDPDRSDAFVRLIKRLRTEYRFAVLMVTHDLDTLHDLSDRVSVLADQHIIASGTIEEVRTVPHRFVENFFGGERGRRTFTSA